jgi:hypothetical protein
MQKLDFISQLKLRGSWGKIGDDGFSAPRWPFRDAFSYGGNTQMGPTGSTNTPYTIYRASTLGNPNLGWEIVEKRNFGLDYGFFNGDIAGAVDVFKDKRSDIVMEVSSNPNVPGRSIPSFYGFGTQAPRANLGQVTSKGYELELRLNHKFGKNLRLWANTNMTHAENMTDFRDDPELFPNYRKSAGYSIGQTTAHINNGFLRSWDDVYGSTLRLVNNGSKLPGDFNIADFNGDGTIDDNDQAPYGYTGDPQNTYNATLGFDWKSISFFVQFYGVNNVTREVRFQDFQVGSNLVFKQQELYDAKTGQGEVPLSRTSPSSTAGGGSGTRYLYDASFWRLKTAEIGYSLPASYIKKLGIKTARLYVNGNNLYLWTKMPDDRESNFANGNFGGSGSGAYPTMRRFNLGIDLTL